MDNSNGVDLSDLIVFACYLTGIVMVLRVSHPKIVFYGMLALAFIASSMIFKFGLAVEMLGFAHMLPIAMVCGWLAKRRKLSPHARAL